MSGGQVDLSYRQVRQSVGERIGIDARALAVFRIGLGLLLLLDLGLRARWVRAHYTDAGVMPSHAVTSLHSPFQYSLHLLVTELWFQALLFLVSGVLAIALVVGYRTRISILLSWLLLLSLQNRNPFLLNGGDTLFRMLLLWGIFLPLGARWSIDSRRRDGERSHVRSLATVAVLFQFVVMYVSNAVLKARGDLWYQGKGLEYALSLRQMTYLLGDVVATHAALFSHLDVVWMAMLVAAPLLPVVTGWRRVLFTSLFVGMHLGMALTLQIGIFPLVAVTGLVLFYPPTVWDRLEAIVERTEWPALLARADDGLPAGALPTVPTPPASWAVTGQTVLVALFLTITVLSNAQSMGFVENDRMPASVENATMTDQRFGMFAPDPPRTDMWIVAPGTLEDGTRVDVLHEREFTWERPDDLSNTFRSARWRLYHYKLTFENNSVYRAYFADYLCRQWNRDHRRAVTNLSIVEMEQATRLSGPEPITRKKLVDFDCVDRQPTYPAASNESQSGG